MARDRQRAKQRQAERRAARLRERSGDGTPAEPPASPQPESASPDEDPAASGSDQSLLDPPSAAEAPGDPTPDELEAGAPPQATGRSDTVLESPPPAPHLEADEEEEYDFEDEKQPLEPETAGPRGRRGAELAQEERRGHGRVLTFLLNVWAELQRVQWPDRQAVVTLTTVVLGFVLIAGGYLGLLDAIFSRIIERLI